MFSKVSFQSQSVPKGQLNQVLKTEDRCYAQHLVRKLQPKGIAPEIFPVGNPAQHKTPQSLQGWLAFGQCVWAGRNKTKAI